jgi:RNA recognition motif-containing protein
MSITRSKEMLEAIRSMGKPEITMLLSLFSLAWFLMGYVMGRQSGKSRGNVSRDNGSRGRQFNSRRRDNRDRDGDRGGDRDSRSRPDPGNVEMYVGNLSFSTEERELSAMFEEFGKVASARIIKNKFNNKSKGFGFVEMPDRADAMRAIKALSGKEIEGRRVVVNEAKSSARD